MHFFLQGKKNADFRLMVMVDGRAWYGKKKCKGPCSKPEFCLIFFKFKKWFSFSHVFRKKKKMGHGYFTLLQCAMWLCYIVFPLYYVIFLCYIMIIFIFSRKQNYFWNESHIMIFEFLSYMIVYTNITVHLYNLSRNEEFFFWITRAYQKKTNIKYTPLPNELKCRWTNNFFWILIIFEILTKQHKNINVIFLNFDRKTD